MKTIIGYPLAVMALSLAPTIAGAESVGELCQRLAGEKQHGGVWFHALDAKLAVPSCKNAVAINKDDERSITNLARAYLKAKEYKIARELLKTVDGPFRGRALNMQAYMLEQGLGGKVDHATAFDIYRRAAETGYHPAQNNLGDKYQRGEGIPIDYSKARYWYLKSAAQGNAYAQNSLGYMFGTGIGVAVDGKVARLWYEKAAQQNFADALSNLAHYYQNGQFTDPNPVKALAYAKRSASQGNVNGLHNLGQFYLEGFAVEKNFATAWGLFLRGAEQAHDRSQFKLGWMIENGWGRKVDLKEAASWYRLAAAQGLAWAQFNLARLNERGAASSSKPDGAPRDLRKAELFYRRAAEQNYGPSQDALAALHLRIPQFEHFRKDAIQWRMLAYANSSDSHLHDVLAGAEDPIALKELRQALISFGGKPKDNSLTELTRSLDEWSASEKPDRLLNRLDRSR